MKEHIARILPGSIRRLLLSWLFSVTLGYLLLPRSGRGLSDMAAADAISGPLTLVVTVGMTAVLWLLSAKLRTERFEQAAFPVLFTVLSVLCLCGSFSWGLLAGCVLILAMLTLYALRGANLSPDTHTPTGPIGRLSRWIIAGFALLFFLFVSTWGISRWLNFRCPNFDFGLFNQMFYSMEKTGLPLTTLERDGLLSHFQVHVSPIYYLMLPFYMIFPSPATLQVLQAAVMTSSVIPLVKLCRHHGLSRLTTVLLALLLLLLPAFSGGASYDLHENCFLTPLLLWLLYGLDRGSLPITGAAALLTLSVKEDAAVYVAVIAVYFLLRTLLHPAEKQWKAVLTGSALLGISLLWFLAATSFLASRGDGVMTNRYKNLMGDSSSLLGVVRTVLLCPMKAVFECTEPGKGKYILCTLIPLLGLPLMTRRYERLLLVIPYLLFNLMSDYVYQHDLFFQYSFGSTACLIYLTVRSIADMKSLPLRSIAAFTAAAAAAIFFGFFNVPKAAPIMKSAISQRTSDREVRAVLGRIPEDAKVTASTFLTTDLARRRVLYSVGDTTKEHLLSCDTVILKLDYVNEYKKWGGQGELILLLERNGYRQTDGVPGRVAVYVRPSQ